MEVIIVRRWRMQFINGICVSITENETQAECENEDAISELVLKMQEPL